MMGTHLLLPRGPVEQLLGLGLAGAMAMQVSPDVGYYAQKYLTTAIPFNLQILNMTKTTDFWGRSAHFVAVAWCDSQ
jgi:hypothetical protein